MSHKISNQYNILSVIDYFRSQTICFSNIFSLTSSACQIYAISREDDKLFIYTPIYSLYGSQSPLPNYLNQVIDQSDNAKPILDTIQTHYLNLHYALWKKISTINMQHRRLSLSSEVFSKKHENIVKLQKTLIKISETDVVIKNRAARWSKIMNPTVFSSHNTNKLGDTTSIGEYLYTEVNSYTITLGPISPLNYTTILKARKIESLESAIQKTLHKGSYKIHFMVTPWSMSL